MNKRITHPGGIETHRVGRISTDRPDELKFVRNVCVVNDDVKIGIWGGSGSFWLDVSIGNYGFSLTRAARKRDLLAQAGAAVDGLFDELRSSTGKVINYKSLLYGRKNYIFTAA